jgi:hypothetical protein
MYRFAAAGAALIVLAGPALADPPRHDTILTTLDRFMIARSVSAHCGRADAATATSFQRHYRLVTEQAMIELKALSSDLTRERIEKVMADHYTEIDRHVAAIVAQESCDGSHIKEALQKYDSVANADDAQLMADKKN